MPKKPVYEEVDAFLVQVTLKATEVFSKFSWSEMSPAEQDGVISVLDPSRKLGMTRAHLSRQLDLLPELFKYLIHFKGEDDRECVLCARHVLYAEFCDMEAFDAKRLEDKYKIMQDEKFEETLATLRKSLEAEAKRSAEKSRLAKNKEGYVRGQRHKAGK